MRQAAETVVHRRARFTSSLRIVRMRRSSREGGKWKWKSTSSQLAVVPHAHEYAPPPRRRQLAAHREARTDAQTDGGERLPGLPVCCLTRTRSLARSLARSPSTSCRGAAGPAAAHPLRLRPRSALPLPPLPSSNSVSACEVSGGERRVVDAPQSGPGRTRTRTGGRIECGRLAVRVRGGQENENTGVLDPSLYCKICSNFSELAELKDIVGRNRADSIYELLSSK